MRDKYQSFNTEERSLGRTENDQEKILKYLYKTRDTIIQKKLKQIPLGNLLLIIEGIEWLVGIDESLAKKLKVLIDKKLSNNEIKKRLRLSLETLSIIKQSETYKYS